MVEFNWYFLIFGYLISIFIVYLTFKKVFKQMGVAFGCHIKKKKEKKDEKGNIETENVSIKAGFNYKDNKDA